MPDEHVYSRLFTLFLDELTEQLRVMGAELRSLEQRPHDAEALRALFRAMHTLKGAASVASVPMLADCCHQLETVLARVRDQGSALSAPEIALLVSAVDALEDARARLVASRTLAGSPLQTVLDGMNGMDHGDLLGAEAIHGEQTTVPESSVTSPTAAPTPKVERDEYVRISVARLDELLSASSRLVLAAQRIAAGAAKVNAWRDDAWTLLSRVSGADSGSGSGTGGALARQLHLSVQHAVRIAGGLVVDSRSLGVIADDITDRAGRLLMRPFADVAEPLGRVIRNAETATSKQVRLEVSGGDVEADRRVLDALREALPHLVRNAVDHGIEAPDVRRRAGKPPVGTLRIGARTEGRRLTVTVSDDGAGMDVDAIVERLVRRGAPVPGDRASVLELAFESGFSTRAYATSTSGRGVGLDAVRSAISRVSGTVRVSSPPRGGATFVLDCPLDVAMVRVLLFSAAGRTLALPTSVVERLFRIRTGAVRIMEGRRMLALPDGGGSLPLIPLTRLLGAGDAEGGSRDDLVIVVNAGTQRAGLLVDEFVAEQEVVVKPLPGLDIRCAFLAGAALVGDDVALLLNPAALMDTLLTPVNAIRSPEHAQQGERWRVLLVDDTRTTLEKARTLFEQNGYSVLCAATGDEAWGLLHAHDVDLVVTDVEMPRMDGLTLCRAIRNSARFRALPVVLLTGLGGAAHRAAGLAAGADAYVEKAALDWGELLDIARSLLER